MAHPPTRSTGPFRPTRLGQWEVIAKIAGGGMSAVYLGRKVGSAENLSDIPTVVALKIVRHDVRNEKMLQMFLEEGHLIARLVHPNIVRTLEVSGDAEQDFIAMELMLGKTFAAIHDAIVARDVRLNPEIAAWTAARVADALHYAHELTDESGLQPLGLVHRDVNPANIFATFNGEIKLFDFGLAKSTAGEASGSHLLAGKLSYLSPEQIMQMPLDRRSDIFSLGTTLWELLTGRRLFRRESDLDTVRAVQLGPIPDPRTVAPEIPEELARIAKTALERNREHRYPTATYLARELDAFVYTRTSPGDVTARLAQLVDTLFPGEQKKQHGWLKPAINKAIISTGSSGTPGPVSMMLGPSSRSAGWASSGRPSPPPRSLSPRETTAVMPNAPRRPESSPNLTGGADSAPPTPSSPASSPRLPSSPSSGPRLPSAPTSSPPASRPSRPSVPNAPRSSQRIPVSSPPDTTPITLPDPPSLIPTPREGIPSVVLSSSPPAAAAAPAPAPAPTATATTSAAARASWPIPQGRGGSVAPPPQRTRPPTRGPSIPAPPPSPTPGSRTDIHAPTPELYPNTRTDLQAPIAAPTPVPVAQAKPMVGEESTPSLKPGSLAGGFQRPKRAPIPLPSRLKTGAAAVAGDKKTSASIPPPATVLSPGATAPTARPSQAPPPMTKPSVGMGQSRPLPVTAKSSPTKAERTSTDTDPPNSDTQVDMQVPPAPPLPGGSQKKL